ncbi:MAG TPA: pitrilysin family protein, partial [Nitrospira sp.]|nr:pitrilysin family protein [Nitrospira sp.]
MLQLTRQVSLRISHQLFYARFLVLSVVAIIALHAPALAAEIVPTRVVAPNGMTVLVLEQHFLPIVEVLALVKTGSAQDPPDKAGLANLVASLLDEGTATRTSKQLAEQIDFVGGSLEVRASEDFTTASARVIKKDIDLGFTLLADILQHPAFPKVEFERIRSQILGEMASDNDDPGHVAMKAFNQLVFHGHPYRWPLNGTEESLAKISHADVLNFYNKEYVPSQVILTVVGDVTAEQVATLVGSHFGTWKKPALPARTIKKAAPLQRKTVQLIQKDLTQSNVILGHGGISRTNPDFYAVTVMNYVLGAGGFSSRLMDSIRDKQGLVYGIMSHFDARLMPGSFWINFQTRTETTNQAIQSVL